MSSIVYTPETKGENEPYTFTSKFISMETSSLKKSLRSIKVDEGKCEDDIGISYLLGVFCFTMKVIGATFATNVMVLGVRTVP